MGNKGFYVMLENEWFYNRDKATLLQMYYKDCLLVYSILLRDLTIRNTVKFKLDDIYNVLKVDKNKNLTMVNKTKDAIMRMNDELYVLYTDSKCENKLDTNKLDNNTTYYALLERSAEDIKDNFFIVHDSELDTIIDISIAKKMSKDDIYAQFAYYCKSFGGDKKEDNYRVCYPSFETIEKYTDNCRSTIIRNNTIFKEIGLLLVGNAGANIIDDDYKNVSNIYARAEHVKEFEKYLEIMKQKVEIKNNVKQVVDIQNNQRRAKQKINQWKKEHDINNLSESEWIELRQLEKEYVAIVKSRGQDKVKKGTGLITLYLDGREKKYEDYNYNFEDEEDYTPVQKELDEKMKIKGLVKSDDGVKNPFGGFYNNIIPTQQNNDNNDKSLDDEQVEETVDFSEFLDDDDVDGLIDIDALFKVKAAPTYDTEKMKLIRNRVNLSYQISRDDEEFLKKYDHDFWEDNRFFLNVKKNII